MTDDSRDPRQAYDALAGAMQTFQTQAPRPTGQDVAALREAVARATEVWQHCEPMRAARGKEFRYHVVKLKLLLAGAAQALEDFSDGPLPAAA